MGIPVSQLQTWSDRPDSASSARTYASIQSALDKASALARYGKNVYLQGSYANATNIRSDSDVDVVAELTSSFVSDTHYLDAVEKARYDAAFVNSTTTLDDFRRDVRGALVSAFGSGAVTSGNKCLKIAGNSNRLRADVLVCQQHRVWVDFPSRALAQSAEGVTFQTADGRWVVNYPTNHKKNGEQKQSETSDHYKRTVRMFKNARRKLLVDGKISPDVSPSYFVECLLFNVPNKEFVSDLTANYLGVLIWLGEDINSFSSMRCQNKIIKLFGATPEQWDVGRAGTLITELLRQSNGWGK